MAKNVVSKPMHEQVAEKVIDALRAGTAPWQRPWDVEGMQLLLPYNFQSGKRYHGINAVSLLTTGRDDPRWMTYRQAEEGGFQVRKGEKSTLIQFVKTSDERVKRDQSGKILHDELGEPIKESKKLPQAVIRNAYVFNAAQIDGMPILERTVAGSAWDPIDKAEKLIAASGAKIYHEYSGKAFYDLNRDSITLPYKDWFSHSDKYYATVLHELGHWTGHPDRLNRDMGNDFGDPKYAKEELRAEIASMLLGQELGIGHDSGQHYAYVENWINLLEDNPYEIFSAAMDAEKILSFILGLDKKQELSLDHEEEHFLGLPPVKVPTYLTTGDKIHYNDAIYEVLGHLKKGRVKMQDTSSGNVFTMNRNDRLYTSLLYLKREEALANQQNELIKNVDETEVLPFLEPGR
ncbi:ArdC family protein [Pedobacter suwonensis]